MEKKINIAELLKDCPSGMELDCMMYEDVFFDYVDELNIIHCYIKNETHKTSITFNQHGTPNSDIKSKCVIFPKGRTTWEGFVPPYQFKDGDVIFGRNKACSYITIYKHFKDKNSFYYYACLTSLGRFLIDNFADKLNLRLATEEEKQKLFDAIKDKGYKWNAETKTLEKLPKFKNGDIILKSYFVAIVSYIESSGRIWYHCWYNTKYKDCKFKNDFGIGDINDSDEVRFATEEEKEKLFQAIKANGYKWNSDTKILEKLIEPKFKVGNKIVNIHRKHLHCDSASGKISQITDDKYIFTDGSYISISNQDNWELVPNKFDITTLKPFDKVLVKTDVHNPVWSVDFYDGYNIEVGGSFTPFAVTGGKYFQQCIPYEGNEHLRGTTEDCDNFYKTWEK